MKVQTSAGAMRQLPWIAFPALLVASAFVVGAQRAPRAGEGELQVLDTARDGDPHGMLRSYLQNIASGQLASRKQQIAQISTREQFEARRAEVREKILKLIGPMPTERAPLNLRTVGKLDRGDYRVEKVIYESLPKFYVTADLYVPQTGKPPYPAILYPNGHGDRGKVQTQTECIALAKYGFVVLNYDPIGQGERLIFFDKDLGASKIGPGVLEHQMVGLQSLLAGQSVARYRIWDGMRGIDLLQTLKEVDPKRIGVTGCSGGGTLTVYIAALDDRVKVAAPACYVTSWEDQLDGTGPQDAEQEFPDQLLNGIDHADFVTLFAPKPYLIRSTTEDFFPIEGARKTYEEARRIYSLFGAEDRISWFKEPGTHGTPKANRESMYAWMKHWLKGDPAGPAPEPELHSELEEDLECTPTGQVATSLGGETASSLNIKQFADIVPPRPALKTAAELQHFQARVEESVLRLTRYAKSAEPLNIQSRGEVTREGYRIERLVYDSDRGLHIPALLSVPDPARARAEPVIYVDQDGKASGFTPNGDADHLARLGYTVLALDPAGIGEIETQWGSYSVPWFGQDKVIWLGLMVGRPLTGIRMNDIVRGLDVLSEKKLLTGGRAIVFGKGLIATAVLHAAVLDPRIQGLILQDSLVSYRAIAQTPLHRRIFDAILPGTLSAYDLPDLVAALAPRPVSLVNARSPLGQALSITDMQASYKYAMEAYSSAGAPERFQIHRRRGGGRFGGEWSDLGFDEVLRH